MSSLQSRYSVSAPQFLSYFSFLADISKIALLIIFISLFKVYLKTDVDQNDEERVGEVEEQPDLHRFDVWGCRQAGGDRQVDRGQDHHAGDVDGVDQTELVLVTDVVGGLVDDVHQDGGQVGDHDDVEQFPAQRDGHSDGLPRSSGEVVPLYPPLPDAVLLHCVAAHVGETLQVQLGQQVVRPHYPELEGAHLGPEGEVVHVIKGADKPSFSDCHQSQGV